MPWRLSLWVSFCGCCWCLLSAKALRGWAFLFFERNKPATSEYPFYSLASDFKFFFDILRDRQAGV
ncbi:Mpo1-like protein [Pontibacter pamirensis]|uniref:Mpo1-like protein n=1 Tax=Pontibacter pamirensis TaxID=2562824 RepID=UPI001F468AC7|nr:Mpo1-like protein [Pontibacter pamirensis]